MLYILNLHRAVSQLYLNKTGKKWLLTTIPNRMTQGATLLDILITLVQKKLWPWNNTHTPPPPPQKKTSASRCFRLTLFLDATPPHPPQTVQNVRTFFLNSSNCLEDGKALEEKNPESEPSVRVHFCSGSVWRSGRDRKSWAVFPAPLGQRL